MIQKSLFLNGDNVSEATIGVYAKALASARDSIAITAQEKDVEVRIGTEKCEIW